MPLYPDAPLNRDDELALLDEDDSVDLEDEIHGMKIRTVIAFKPLSRCSRQFVTAARRAR